MGARWSFIGHPMSQDQADNWPEGIAIRDDIDGTYVERARTAILCPRCRHASTPAGHPLDRNQRPVCWSPACGCAFREDPK
jgi:hypothetical protein